MPRGTRLVLPNVPLHITQRGNNRQACFHTLMDYRCYLKWLGEYAEQTGCRIHAYALMTNHVHLLVSADTKTAPSAMMKALSQRYSQYFNRVYKRTGTLWEGRFRSCVVDAEDYLLACMRYIELNPVRAGMVKHPADYLWSSYRANAQMKECTLVEPHEVLMRLRSHSRRMQGTGAYCDLFRDELNADIVREIRQATGGNYVVGSANFRKAIEATHRRRAKPLRAGRPRKAAKIGVCPGFSEL